MSETDKTADAFMRRYLFKLYPNKEQAEHLDRQRKMMADLWNAALAQREAHWSRECQRHGAWETTTRIDKKTGLPRVDKQGEVVIYKKRQGLSRFDQAPQIKVLREEFPEWRQINSATPAVLLQQLDLAFAAFFRRIKEGAEDSGYPKFKRRDKAANIPFREMGMGWSFARASEIAEKSVMGRCAARQRERILSSDKG